MARFFKREWSERRGGEYDRWGTSTWYFEVGEDLYPKRQLELYESGDSLGYDGTHLNDEYGGLGDQPLEGAEWDAFEISADEFESAWTGAKLRNR
jgi:hypothetical protein